MSKIYTKTGDSGKTSLSGSAKVSKDDLRIEVIGEFDEISSHLGVALSFGVPEKVRLNLQQIQKSIYKLNSSGGELISSISICSAGLGILI